MGLFSKKKKSESLLSDTLASLGADFWTKVPSAWFNDPNVETLGNLGDQTSRSQSELESQLFNLNADAFPTLVASLEFDDSGLTPANTRNSKLKTEVKENLTKLELKYFDSGIPDNQIKFWLPSIGLDEKEWWSIGTFEFFESKAGEFAYVHTNVAFHGWPFDPKFSSNREKEQPSLIDCPAHDLVQPYIEEIRLRQILPSFIAFAEVMTLAGINSDVLSKRDISNFILSGRSVHKKLWGVPEDEPRSRYRIRPNQIDMHDVNEIGTISAQLPMVLECGFTFRTTTSSDRFWEALLQGLSSMRLLLEDGDCHFGNLMNAAFCSPSAWRIPLSPTSKLIPATPNHLKQFLSDVDYKGDWNSYVYNFLLPKLAVRQVDLSLVEKYLSEIKDEPNQIIGLGNLSLAQLTSGNLATSGETLIQFAQRIGELGDDQDTYWSEAVFIGEKINELGGKAKYLTSVLDLVGARKLNKEKPPAWLLQTLPENGMRASLNLDKKIHLEKLSNITLIRNISEQISEILPKIDKYEFIQFYDVEDLRPVIAITSDGDAAVLFSIFNGDGDILPSYPWLENQSKYEDVLEFSVQKSFLTDTNNRLKFLCELFDSYNKVEVEMEPLPGTKPRVNTFLPIRKKELSESFAGTSSRASNKGYTGPTYFWGMTQEITIDSGGFF